MTITDRKRVVEWVRQRLRRRGRKLTETDREEIQDNLVSNDFYPGAQIIREKIGVDFLIGITQSMIAGEDDDVFWNYFSTAQDHILLVSTYDLRAYSKQAKRPFEVALAMLCIAELMVTINPEGKDPLEFHKDRGCVFDDNVYRLNVAKCIRKLTIEKGCLKKMDAKYRDAAVQMLDALRAYVPKNKPAPSKKRDREQDDFWLDQLDKLGEE